MFYLSGNICLSTALAEEIKTEADQTCATVPPSNPRAAYASMSSGHVTSEESDPPKLPWPKSPESYSSVAESTSALTEGEESDVESRGSGLEPGEASAVLSGERNGFKVPSVRSSVNFYRIMLSRHSLSTAYCMSESYFRKEITFHICGP